MDPATITAIGALVGITKSVIDTFKSLRDLLDSKDPQRVERESQSELEKVNENFDAFRKRLKVLAIQLEQSEALTRMIPAWLEVASLMPMWEDVNELSRNDLRRIHDDLRSLVHESVRDHFSGTFFRTNFDQLPEIERQLDIFRSKLEDLDRTVNSIAPGNITVFKGQWGTITTQFNDLENAAREIERLAGDVQGALIRELRDSAEQVVI